jgi:tetratricopeptide (TPR) repeat protein
VRILDRVKQFWELRRLKAAARAHPSPATLGALAERFISFGRIEDAYRTAKQGISLFPTSDRLAKVCTFAKKQRLQTEIRRLRRELVTRPAPIVFSQLAEIYRQLGKNDQALEICQQCLEKFPLNENPYLIIGELRLARFLSELIAHDGIEAEKQLRRVVQINGQNVKAHMLLANLCYVVGAIPETIESLQAVLANSPDNQEIEAFIAEQGSRIEGAGNAPVSDRVREVERTHTLVNQPETFPGGRFTPDAPADQAATLDVEALRRSLSAVGKKVGVKNALIQDRDGEPLADFTHPDSLTRGEFSELVSDLVTTSEDASRRMDVGAFQWCSVEGDFGGVAVTKAKNLAVAMKFDPNVNSERAQSLLEDFTARNLTMPGEVTRA